MSRRFALIGDEGMAGVDNDPSRPLETIDYRKVPINPLDALLRCAPGDEPSESAEERRIKADLVSEAIDCLKPLHRFCVEAIHAERLSFRELGARLGVSHTEAHRTLTEAHEAMRLMILNHPYFRKRFQMFETWDEAARDAVASMSPVGSGMPHDAALSLIDRKMGDVRRLVHSHQLGTDTDIALKMQTIGYGAACILDGEGAWSEDEMLALLVRKQHDYGHGNINAFGMVGVAVRASDKVARYHNLKGKPAANEPRVDALVDIVGYAVIARMLADGTFQLPLATDGTLADQVVPA